MNYCKLLFFTFFFFVISHLALSQIKVSNLHLIDRIKNGKTFLVVKDTSSVFTKEYLSILKTYWNLTEISLITYGEEEKYLALENSFFSFGYETVTSSGNSVAKTNSHLYFEFWTFDEKSVIENRKKVYPKIQIARIELFTDIQTLEGPSIIFNYDINGYSHFKNWNLGFFKNYVQKLVTCLNNKEERYLYNKLVNKDELSKLLTGTLYVPIYILNKFDPFTGDESEMHNLNKLFGDYKLRYEMISQDELDEIIMNESKSVYYLVYVKSSTHLFFNIVNSSTGDIIYSDYTYGYNIKPKNIKRLYNLIKKLASVNKN